MKLFKLNKNGLYFILISGLFFLMFNGNVNLFDWDEINFAEAAREMIVTGDYLNVRIDYQPFHEKPPLFIWFQAVSMHVFGINEFAARLPNAIFGVLTMIMLIQIGKIIFDDNFGLLWALVYFGSLLPHFYFKSSIIDPVFNFFMYGGIYYLFRFSQNKIDRKTDNIFILYAGLFTSFAFLTKGPVGFLLVFLTWAMYWLLNNKTFKLPYRQVFLFTFISFLPALIWYTAIYFNNGSGMIGEFIMYQIRLLTTGDAGHEGPFYYHFLVVFLGCFPASVFIFQAFKNYDDTPSQKSFKQFNLILLAVVLVIFSLVKTKIVHYSSLAYFPVTFLAAYTLYKVQLKQIKINMVSKIVLGIIGVIISSAFIAFPLVLMNIHKFLPDITDKLTNALLRAEVNWTGLEISVGFVIMLGIIAFFILERKRLHQHANYSLFGSIAIALFLFLPMMAPKIETYTQRAPVDFFKNLIGKDVYVHTLGYKSYAPYFYQRKELVNSRYYLKMSGAEYEEYLMFGNIDKPAYFAAKINNYEDYIKKQPELKELYRKNGYIFFARMNR